MKYENIKNYGPEKFLRITGIKIKTYKKCIKILNKKYSEEHAKNLRKSGRKSKLSMEDKLLATLEYLREYRTYAHIAASYGVHESQIARCVRWVETTLIKDGTFFIKTQKTPKKKAKKHFLTKSDKAINRKISSERVQNEHAIAFIICGLFKII